MTTKTVTPEMARLHDREVASDLQTLHRAGVVVSDWVHMLLAPTVVPPKPRLWKLESPIRTAGDVHLPRSTPAEAVRNAARMVSRGDNLNWNRWELREL